MSRQNVSALSKAVRKLLLAEQRMSETLDELTQIDQQVNAGLLASPRSFASDRELWEALPESSRKNIVQSILGVKTLEIKWNDRHTRAEVRVDGERYPDQPRMVALLLQALCAMKEEPSERLVGWKSVQDLQDAMAQSSPRGRKSHSITQLLHRLRKLIPNQMLLDRAEEPTRYRFALRRDAQVTID